MPVASANLPRGVCAVVQPAEHGGRAGVWAFRVLLYAGLIAGFVYGGPVARVAAACAALFALLGDCSGGARHLCKLVGLIVAIWLAPMGGQFLAPHLGAQFGWSPAHANLAGMGLTIAGVLIAATIIGRLTTSLIRRSPGASGANKVFGGLLGATEGALLVAVVVWTLNTFDGPLGKMRDQLAARLPEQYGWVIRSYDAVHEAVASDPAAQWANSLNPLPQAPLIPSATHLADVLADPQIAAALADDPRVKEFLATPAVQRHIEAFDADPAIHEALKNHNVAAIFTSRHFADMLGDAELYETVTAHWEPLKAALAAAHAAVSEIEAEE